MYKQSGLWPRNVLDVQAVRGFGQEMYLMYRQSGALAKKCT